MRDRYGRPVTSLRFSVTNRCNLDCFYCHREGCPEGDREIAPEEIGEIVRAGIEFGIKKIKLTGGEPLMRNDIEEIVLALNLPQIEDVSMTTNGTMLWKRANDLKEAGLDRVNISLDTLTPNRYERITGKAKLNFVLKGIDAALDAGFWPVKLNMVVLNNINDDEIERMIEYSLDLGAILQIIELLRTPETAHIYERYHVNLDSYERSLKERAKKIKTRWLVQARRKYLLDGVEVEIVNPMHNSEFCSHCSRIRMTPDGCLKPCLMRSDNLVDALGPLRSGDGKALREAFVKAIDAREPYHKKQKQ